MYSSVYHFSGYFIDIIRRNYVLIATGSTRILHSTFFIFIHQVECEDIGQLVKIRVGHDNNGMRSAWFLEKVK